MSSSATFCLSTLSATRAWPFANPKCTFPGNGPERGGFEHIFGKLAIVAFDWLAEQDGVSLTAEDNDGRQPIHIACDNGHLELVKWLAEQDGVSLTAEDNDGWQPIHRTHAGMDTSSWSSGWRSRTGCR
jgi:hypothetical protein